MLGTPRAKKASRCLDAGQDGAADGAAASDSDSGASLFLTQHCVPGPVRSARRRRSAAPSSTGATQDGPSLLASPRKPILDTAGKSLRFRLPKYTFNLPKEKPTSLTLTTRQNIEMHYAVMGGFFTNVRELLAGWQTGDALPPLPTVDMKGESIAPISEGEETSEDEHIRIVEKKHLVVLSKTKRTQPWYNPQKRGSGVKPPCDKGPDSSRGTRREASRSGFRERDSSGRVVDKTPAIHNEPLVQTKASQAKKKIVFEWEEKEGAPASDSDATFCEFAEEFAQRISETSTDRDEPQTDASLTSKHSRSQEEERAPGGRSNKVCSESREQNKKTKGSRGDTQTTEEEMFQSQEELAELHHGQSVTVDETPELPPTIVDVDTLLHSDAQGERDMLDSTQKKKKRHRRERKSTEEETSQSLEEPVELHNGKSVIVDETPDLPPTIDEVDSLSLGDAQDEGNMLDSKQKKIKKKKNRHRVDSKSTEEEMSQSQEEAHELHNVNCATVDETPDPLPSIMEVDDLLQGDAQKEGDLLDSKQKKKKKKKRRRGDPESAEEEMSQSQEEPKELQSGTLAIVDETPDLPPTINDSEAQNEGHVTNSKKKKKKKKKSKLADDDTVEGHMDSDVRMEDNMSVLSSCCSEEGGKKKKKRKRRAEDALQVASEEAAELHQKKKGSNATSDQTEQIDEAGDCLETPEATLEVSEFSKQKKKKKKHHSVCNDDPQGGEVGADVSSSLDVISPVESQELPVKKKKRTSVNGGAVLTPEEEKAQITAEGAEDQDAGLQAKKKKKKKTREDPGLSICGDTAVQSDDSVSVREKEKRGAASFPAADAERSASESAGIRGSLVEQEQVRKKKKRGKVSECAADANCSITDVDVAVKKKKRKLAGDEPVESVLDTWSSPTPNTGHDASMVEQVSPYPQINQDDVKEERKRKKKKLKGVFPEDKLFSGGTEQKVKDVLSDSSASSRTVGKNSHRKSKRSLHNPNTDFLTAC